MAYAVVTECNDAGNHTSSIGTTENFNNAKKFLVRQYNNYVGLLKANNLQTIRSVINIESTDAAIEFIRGQAISWVHILIVETIDIDLC